MTENNIVPFPEKQAETVPPASAAPSDIRTREEMLTLFTNILNQPAEGRAETY